MKTQFKKEKGNSMLCQICGEKIVAGQSWSHDPEIDEMYHLECEIKRHEELSNDNNAERQ